MKPMMPDAEMEFEEDAPDEVVADTGSDTRAQLAAIDAKSRDAVVETIGGRAPEASEPLPGPAVSALQATLEGAMTKLSGGEFELPEAGLLEDDLERLPPETYAALVAFSSGIGAAVKAGIAAARPYAFDPKAAASSEAGMMDAIEKIRRAGEDSTLLAAVQKRNPSTPTPAAPPAAPPEDPAMRLARVALDRRTSGSTRKPGPGAAGGRGGAGAGGAGGAARGAGKPTR